MPTIVGILTLMSQKKFMVSSVEHEKSFITSGPDDCCNDTQRQIKVKKIWVLRPFQEYFTYVEPIVNQRWAKTGVPGEKSPDLPVQNFASYMYTERGSNHSG